MILNFNRNAADIYFPNFQKTVSGDNLVCYDGKQYVVVIRDISFPNPTGAWIYDTYNVEETEYRFPEIPDSDKRVTSMPGFFGRNDFLASALMGAPEPDQNLPVVIAVCGESGSGKTTLTEDLKNHGIPSVVSYTTRPMRPDETDGIGHRFVSEYPGHSDDELAYTFFGGYHYWALFSELPEVTTYCIDEAGILDLIKARDAGKIRLVWMEIKRPDNPTDKSRKNRDKDRTAAVKKLHEMNEYPDITIVNDYPDAETFINKESENIADYINNAIRTNQ